MFDLFKRKPGRKPEAPAETPPKDAQIPPPAPAATPSGGAGAVARSVPDDVGGGTIAPVSEAGTGTFAAESAAPSAAIPSAPSAAGAFAPVPSRAAATIEPLAGEASETATPEKRSWRDRLKAGLGLSRDKLSGALTGAFRRRVLDDEALDELESALLMADVGVEATQYLLDELRTRYRRAGPNADPRALLRAAFADLVRTLEAPVEIGAARPFVIMLAGVNGAGKTTSIGKIAHWLAERKLSVLLAAGDTFRAAAREQLAVWGERNNVAVIQQAGGDPAAVMYDALNAARSRKVDVVLADTAGRLPTQAHLMEELRKIKRVLGKARDGAPDDVWLVLDANTGQNGLAQVRAFDAAIGLTGLILTKLDGSAKGGIVAAIARQHPIPLRFIGVGEGVDDLRPFKAEEFVEALLPAEGSGYGPE
jgi:fused signal recognition particle receptor